MKIDTTTNTAEIPIILSLNIDGVGLHELEETLYVHFIYEKEDAFPFRESVEVFHFHVGGTYSGTSNSFFSKMGCNLVGLEDEILDHIQQVRGENAAEQSISNRDES